MRIEFPDLKGKESETLFIIGNGFDLHHGISSEYMDFLCWLRFRGYENFVERMEAIFDNLVLLGRTSSLWNDFERTLDRYDVDKIYGRLHTPTNEMYELEKWKAQSFEEVGKTTRRIRPLMMEWAKQINIRGVKPDLELSKDSFYLTFNYTKVLEEVYEISATQICHIHGSVDDDELIVGHTRKSNPESLYKVRDEEEVVMRGYLSDLNELDKDIKACIARHQDFFESIRGVSRVVVLGHSLNTIDLPYIAKVAKKVSQNAHWHFSKHAEKDEGNIRNFEKWYKEDDPTRDIVKWTFNF